MVNRFPKFNNKKEGKEMSFNKSEGSNWKREYLGF